MKFLTVNFKWIAILFMFISSGIFCLIKFRNKNPKIKDQLKIIPKLHNVQNYLKKKLKELRG